MAEQPEKKAKVELVEVRRPQKKIIRKLKDELDVSRIITDDLEHQIQTLSESKRFHNFQYPIYLKIEDSPKVITTHLPDKTAVKITTLRSSSTKEDNVWFHHLRFQVISEKSNIHIYIFNFETKEEEACDHLDNVFISPKPLLDYASECLCVVFDCREM